MKMMTLICINLMFPLRLWNSSFWSSELSLCVMNNTSARMPADRCIDIPAILLWWKSCQYSKTTC